MTLDGVPTTVIGVMAPSFAFPDPLVDVWTPLPLTRAAASDAYSFAGVARLRDGTSVADARAELDRLAVDLERTYPNGGYAQLVSSARTLIEAMVGRVTATLWTLLASVGLVLLVACANVANLFLVRSEAKQREVAVRRALGAGSGGIAGYFLAESAWLSIAGGAVGLALAWGAVHLLVAFGPGNLPRLQEVRLDGVVLAFTLALSLVTGAACGSIPLRRLGPLAVSLHESGRSQHGEPQPPSRPSVPHGRTDRAGPAAPRVVGPSAAQLSSTPGDRSGLQPDIGAYVPGRSSRSCIGSC